MHSKVISRKEPCVRQQTLLFSRKEATVEQPSDKGDLEASPSSSQIANREANLANNERQAQGEVNVKDAYFLPLQAKKRNPKRITTHKAANEKLVAGPARLQKGRRYSEAACTSKDKEIETREVGTSAIAGWTVAEVRKGLGQMRKRWRGRSETSTFCFSQPLLKGMTVEQFATAFLQGQHLKRCNKGKKR